MISLKDTANPNGLEASALLAIVIAGEVFWDVARKDAIVTSLNDSSHSPKSLHYVGRAFDLRTHHLSDEDKRAVVAELRYRLGVRLNTVGIRVAGHYDVILEMDGAPNEHIHVEYDPVFRLDCEVNHV